MAKELTEYIEKTDKLIKSKRVSEDDVKNHLVKIEFFQHERFIHLIVTMSFALFDVLFIFLSIMCCPLVFMIPVLTIFLFFYVIHYYKLENGVQYLYKQYDDMKKIVNSKRSIFNIFK